MQGYKRRGYAQKKSDYLIVRRKGSHFFARDIEKKSRTANKSNMSVLTANKTGVR